MGAQGGSWLIGLQSRNLTPFKVREWDVDLWDLEEFRDFLEFGKIPVSSIYEGSFERGKMLWAYCLEKT